jgi:small multidrug resistance pump
MIFKLLLFVGVLLNVTAQFLLKAGMTRIGPIELNQSITGKFLGMLGNFFFWAGLITYGISFVVYSIVLSRLELGRAYPVSSAAAIILITAASIVFLKESLTLVKILGVLLCSAGIILIFK